MAFDSARHHAPAQQPRPQPWIAATPHSRPSCLPASAHGLPSAARAPSSSSSANSFFRELNHAQPTSNRPTIWSAAAPASQRGGAAAAPTVVVAAAWSTRRSGSPTSTRDLLSTTGAPGVCSFAGDIPRQRKPHIYRLVGRCAGAAARLRDSRARSPGWRPSACITGHQQGEKARRKHRPIELCNLGMGPGGVVSLSESEPFTRSRSP